MVPSRKTSCFLHAVSSVSPGVDRRVGLGLGTRVKLPLLVQQLVSNSLGSVLQKNVCTLLDYRRLLVPGDDQTGFFRAIIR